MIINWKNNFEEGKELVLATSSLSGNPNANVVISLGFFDDKLLIADCLMKTTIDNLESNPKISIVSGIYKINGAVEIFSSGKYFDICVKRSAKISSDKVKNAILVDIKNVFDLYKAKIID